MSRYGHGYKVTLDGLLFIDMSKLKEFGFLNGYRSGVLSWTNSFSDHKSTIGLQVSTYSDNMYAKLNYDLTDSNTGEKKSYDYKVTIIATQCNYGSLRYWFECPLLKNGQPCGRRVRKLYKRGSYFGCRQCLELTYPSQNENPAYRKGMFRIIENETKAEKLLETIKVPYYRGRPTRKMRRYLSYLPTDASITMAYIELDQFLRKGL